MRTYVECIFLASYHYSALYCSTPLSFRRIVYTFNHAKITEQPQSERLPRLRFSRLR